MHDANEKRDNVIRMAINLSFNPSFISWLADHVDTKKIDRISADIVNMIASDVNVTELVIIGHNLMLNGIVLLITKELSVLEEIWRSPMAVGDLEVVGTGIEIRENCAVLHGVINNREFCVEMPPESFMNLLAMSREAIKLAFSAIKEDVGRSYDEQR